jgi:adenylyl-sulfate kinase
MAVDLPAFTVWFTGLPQSGKSTLAGMLAGELRERNGIDRVELLDGDVIRTELCRGLGFSREDRDENVRRIAFVCKLLNRNGIPVIVAAISPYRDARAAARGEIDRFVEVHCAASAEDCARRDWKGNYARARAGEISHFTGVDDPYEEPVAPELRLDTVAEAPERSLARIVARLQELGHLPAAEAPYSAGEEAEVAARLESLGYL